MELFNTYSSVLTAYLDLKDFGKKFMTVYRDLGQYDCIYKFVVPNEGGDSYVRYRFKNPALNIWSIVPEVSDDPDKLEASAVDPQRYLPFDTSGPSSILLHCGWDEEKCVISISVRPEHGSERYYGQLDLKTRLGSVFHENFLKSGSTPNFRITGTPYMKCGA